MARAGRRPRGSGGGEMTLDRKELARLRKVRRFLRIMAHGVGAHAARSELDDWIAQEKQKAAAGRERGE